MVAQLRERRTLEVLALFAGASLFTLAAAAQQGVAPVTSTPAPLVIRVGVDLIQLDASVTDAMGRPAVDLRPEDFNLEVDGRKQVVTNAAYFGHIAPPDPAQANQALQVTEARVGGAMSARDAGENGVVVFVIDDLNLSQEGMYRARRALQTFVRAGGVGGALTAIRVTSDERTSFTLFRSSDDFARALDGIHFTFKGSQGLGGREIAGDSGSVSQGWSASTKPLQAPVINPSQELANTEQRVFSLITTINGLSSIPGRKALVFVSEGFRDLRAPALVGADSPLGSIFRDSGADAASRMITDLANRAFVVIYTADPRGMLLDLSIDKAIQTTPAPPTEGEGSLWRLAAGTGGLALSDRHLQLAGGLSFVMRDQGSYYLIGFEPPAETFARKSGKPAFHAIRLTTNRKDLRVRTRAGFYGVTDRELTEPRRK